MSDRLPAARDSAALFSRFRERRCAESFRGLVENYAGLVQGTAARVLGDGESARDVAQAVFADLVRLAPGLANNTALGGWLHRHTVFLALRQRRSDRRRGQRESEAQRRWSLDNATVEPAAWREALDDALNHLPADERHALALRYFEDLPLRAVGVALGAGEDAAQKRIARALEKLRHLLARRGFSAVSATALSAAVAAIPQPAAGAPALASTALHAAAASSVPAAGAWATFLAMNLKSALTGAAAAALLTGGILAPVILNQRDTIAGLEDKLRAAPPPETPKNVSRPSIRPAAAAAPGPANTRRSEYAEQQARMEPVKDRVKAWTDAVMQIDDAERKQAALDEMLAAMSSANDQDVFAALTAYQSVGSVEFDRGAFRPAIVALLPHGDALIRRTALGFIAALPADDGDIARVTAMAGDSDYGVRKGVVASLFWLTKRNLTGEAGATVLSILNTAETPGRSLIDVMWGAQFTPELEQKLVEFARAPRQADDEELPYYAVYSCLSTQNNKGPACVDLLIERLNDADSYNVGGRAAWGLAYGVQPGLGLEQKIAGAAIKVWRNRSDAYLRNELLKCIRQYGDLSHAAMLDEIAAAPAMGAEQTKQLDEVAAAIRQRAETTQ